MPRRKDYSDVHPTFKQFDVLKSLLTKASKMVVVPRTKTVTVAQATAGKVIICDIKPYAGDKHVDFADWAITASVSDTVADAGTTPSLVDATVTMGNGHAQVELTLPVGTYVAGETITVAVTDYTLPSGIVVTDTVGVITIVANP